MIDHPADWPRHRTHPRRMTPAVPVWPLNAFPPSCRCHMPAGCGALGGEPIPARVVPVRREPKRVLGSSEGLEEASRRSDRGESHPALLVRFRPILGVIHHAGAKFQPGP
jgi:hypothetical protein